MCCCEPSLVRTSGRRVERVRKPRIPKPEISCVSFTRRGGGCAAKVPDLTRGRPVDVDHIITAMLMVLAKPRGEAMRSGVADEPVVVVKHPADDDRGDTDRGENRMELPQRPALKEVAVEAKGGTHRKADCHPHAVKRDHEKTTSGWSTHSWEELATYASTDARSGWSVTRTVKHKRTWKHEKEK